MADVVREYGYIEINSCLTGAQTLTDTQAIATHVAYSYDACQGVSRYSLHLIGGNTHLELKPG